MIDLRELAIKIDINIAATKQLTDSVETLIGLLHTMLTEEKPKDDKS